LRVPAAETGIRLVHDLLAQPAPPEQRRAPAVVARTAAGPPDFSRFAIDDSHLHAMNGGNKTRPSPADRG
jgi:hypothetical protein